ncbi:hypothetical protein SDC9_157377 [bioreactor metagenome]|uniref:Uncharacterized protein n=1 Tax=bioreactor metagenome TaxID=1076179 RepID=A0A645FBZ5_9ZZZZ
MQPAGLSHGGKDEHQCRHKEGQHVVEGGRRRKDAFRNIEFQNPHHAEDKGAADGNPRLPRRKNDKRNRNPPESPDIVGNPDAAVDNHCAVGAAESADAAAQHNIDIFKPCNRNACGIGCSRIFADSLY